MSNRPTWIIVADGGGARFFVRALPGLPLEELEQLAETPRKLDHRHGSHDDVGHGQHAVLARAVPHERAEREFLRHVGGQIDRAVIENQVDQLVLCAPPRALGLLRDFISENSRRLLTGEFPIDVLRETKSQLDERMKAHRL